MAAGASIGRLMLFTATLMIVFLPFRSRLLMANARLMLVFLRVYCRFCVPPKQLKGSLSLSPGYLTIVKQLILN